MSYTIYSLDEILSLDQNYRRNFINSLNGFKSINLCGTADSNGNTNLAIFNSVIHVGANPPLMGMLVRPPVVKRDTLNNIRETGFFTINHVTEEIFIRAHQTSAKYHADKSEFDAVHLTPEYFEGFPVPYVKESKIKIGLQLEEEHTINSNNTIFVVGKIMEVRVPSHYILKDGLIDLHLAETITGSGLDSYYSTRKLSRLSYARPGEDLNKIG
jgi:flavin reductase (DIM6/NTAB) family NADH-FMN oxidoreductase RutF